MLQGNRLQREFLDACGSGHIEVVESLLDRGTDINQADIHGQTPLYIACAYGHREVTELLLDRGADVNQADNVGRTPLLISCKEGHLAILELLISSGADINQANSDGLTPLWTACKNGHIEVAELLLATGADVNQVHSYGLTPLSTSCVKGHLAISELLVSSNKLNGYTSEQLKVIIGSCADQCHAGRANATSYSIIAYRCYKQLQSIDPSYISDDRESTFIGYGRVQQERQAHMLLSLFFDHRKRRVENALPEEVWRKVTTYLPLSWLSNTILSLD